MDPKLKNDTYTTLAMIASFVTLCLLIKGWHKGFKAQCDAVGAVPDWYRQHAVRFLRDSV